MNRFDYNYYEDLLLEDKAFAETGISRPFPFRADREHFREILKCNTNSKSMMLPIHKDNQLQYAGLCELFNIEGNTNFDNPLDIELFNEAFPVAGWHILNYFESFRFVGRKSLKTPANNLQQSSFIASVSTPEKFKQYCEELELYLICCHSFSFDGAAWKPLNNIVEIKNFINTALIEINKNYKHLDSITPFGFKILMNQTDNSFFEKYIEKTITYHKFIEILNDEDDGFLQNQSAIKTMAHCLKSSGVTDKFNLSLINEVKCLSKENITQQLSTFILHSLKLSTDIRTRTRVIEHLPYFYNLYQKNYTEKEKSQTLNLKQGVYHSSNANNVLVSKDALDIMNIGLAELEIKYRTKNDNSIIRLDMIFEMFPHNPPEQLKIILKIFKLLPNFHQQDIIKKLLSESFARIFATHSFAKNYQKKYPANPLLDNKEDLTGMTNKGFSKLSSVYDRLLEFFPAVRDCDLIDESVDRSDRYNYFIKGFNINTCRAVDMEPMDLVAKFMTQSSIECKKILSLNLFNDFNAENISNFLNSELYINHQKEPIINDLTSMINILNRDGDLSPNRRMIEIERD